RLTSLPKYGAAAIATRALQQSAAASGLRIYDPPTDTSAGFLGLARFTTRIRRGRPRCAFWSDNEGGVRADARCHRYCVRLDGACAVAGTGADAPGGRFAQRASPATAVSATRLRRRQ